MTSKISNKKDDKSKDKTLQKIVNYGTLIFIVFISYIIYIYFIERPYVRIRGESFKNYESFVNPKNIIKFSVDLLKKYNNVEVLWAGVKDNLILQNADEISCHIVTLPDTIMNRINRIGQSLEFLSQDTVSSFLKDAIEGGLSI
jgi:transaldolase